jgi:hypothetical protein
MDVMAETKDASVKAQGQMAVAIQLAARKVEFQPKAKSGFEI